MSEKNQLKAWMRKYNGIKFYILRITAFTLVLIISHSNSHSFPSGEHPVQGDILYKRLAFEIQISHNVLNLPDKYNCLEYLASRKTKDFLLVGHDRLISFANKTRFCHVSLTLRTSEQ